MQGFHSAMADAQLNAQIYLWFRYYPKEAPANFAAKMFLLIGIVNFVFTIRTRTWFVMVIPITAAMECGGLYSESSCCTTLAGLFSSLCKFLWLYHPSF